MKITVAAIIPARYASTRLPGKPLADINGKPMVWRVYEQAKKARLVDEVWVATDDKRVYDVVAGLGGNVIMTSPDHPSGTDRLAEAASKVIADVYVNVQGDEPMIPPEMIDDAVRPLIDDPALNMSTAAMEIAAPDEIMDPAVVKVVMDETGNALYFSRAPIPFHRDEWGAFPAITGGTCYKHIGIYVYRREFLFRYAGLPQTALERLEKLEQLRALGHGERIKVVITRHESTGVDTPADLEKVRELLTRMERSL
ncbi:MAG: 3-deoxy-manno-octulosonate cytidylyltransferase [Nitrospirae bacterium]|nr:3-deoxy-manno-octulosonate cytidylyltransferase [Nitrospirota bacterium]